MTIVGRFDVHRAQITFDYVDTASGAVSTGQIRPATRSALRKWVERFLALTRSRPQSRAAPAGALWLRTDALWLKN